MARYPGAVWRPLPEADREPIIRATQVILHTAVSPAASLFGYFSRDDVTVESHFYVNQTGIEQYVDTARQADANRDANIRAISIETWDSGDPDHTPWTPRQLDLLAELIAWCCDTHQIPALKTQAWDAPGIGWHSMWGAPSHWTPVPGKTCPAGPRIAQMPNLIARARALVNQEDDFDMRTDDQIKALVRTVLNEGTGKGQRSWAGTSLATLAGVQDNRVQLGAIRAAVGGLSADDIAARVVAKLPDGDIDQAVVESGVKAVFAELADG